MERALVDQTEMLDTALAVFNDRFPYGLVLLESDLTVRWTSPGLGRILGYPEEQIVGSHVVDLVHEEDLSDIVPMALDVINDAPSALSRPAAASTTEIPVRVRTYSGDWLPVCISGRVVDEGGSLLCVVRPAAERRALDLVLEELGKGAAGQSFDAILDLLCAQFGLSSAWMIHDRDGDVAVHGPAWDGRMGDPEDLLSEYRNRRETQVCFDETRWLIPITTAYPHGLHGLLVVPSVRVGGPSPYDLYVIERTTTLASVAFDRAATDRILHHGATTDYLTGLLNRRAFEQRLSVTKDNAGSFPVAALFIDLNRFKEINDTWGHEVGDRVLNVIASRIDNMTRSSDVVARFGGDEFVVLCRSLGAGELQATRDRLESGIVQPISFQFGNLSVSASIGVSIANSNEELRTLVQRSDRDMYERKNRTNRDTESFSTAD